MITDSVALQRGYSAVVCDGSNYCLEFNFASEFDCSWSTILDELQKDTSFSFSRQLAQTFVAGRLRFYYGADKRERYVFKQEVTNLLAYKGASCTFTRTTNGLVEVRAVVEDGSVQSWSFKTRDLIAPALRAEVERHKMTLRVGALVESARLLSSHEERADLIRNAVRLDELVASELREFLDKQVKSLENRLRKAEMRTKLYFRHKFVGVYPNNEVETLIIFLNYLAISNNRLPGGASIELIDFSPRGIDAICRFAVNSNSPALAVPVEFEFELENFFSHGHDHEQVKVIVCFEAGKSSVGWERFGIRYWIDRTGGLPVLRNSRDDSAVHCVILSELIKEG